MHWLGNASFFPSASVFVSLWSSFSLVSLCLISLFSFFLRLCISVYVFFWFSVFLCFLCLLVLCLCLFLFVLRDFSISLCFSLFVLCASVPSLYFSLFFLPFVFLCSASVFLFVVFIRSFVPLFFFLSARSICVFLFCLLFCVSCASCGLVFSSSLPLSLWHFSG